MKILKIWFTTIENYIWPHDVTEDVGFIHPKKA